MCALFGKIRDINLFKSINSELLDDIISQQCAFYKFKLAETQVNIYGESTGEKYYEGPILLNCLIDRSDPGFTSDSMIIDYNWKIQFRFLRDDLVEINLVPEVGDIILYQERYFEVDTIKTNQYKFGKNPDYPNSPNAYSQELENFGYNVSIICDTHYIPSDKVGITKERLI
jgi:hypothetical protein